MTPEIEAAFPDRITRDANGTLIALDRRQVTFAETRADRLNISLNLRGSIGGGQRGGPPGAGRGSRRGGFGLAARAGGGRPANAAPAPAPSPTPSPAQPPAPPTTGTPRGGPPGTGGGGADRRAAFMQFRTRICAEDGLEVLTQLATAIANGEDVSAIIPGGGLGRLERMVERMKGPDGTIDPERLAAIRTRICSMDPSAMQGPRGGPRAQAGSDSAGRRSRNGSGRPPGGRSIRSDGRRLCRLSRAALR